MIKLRVLKEDFMIGTRRCKKGDIIEVNAPSVAYAVQSGGCEMVKKPIKEAQKPAPKKKAYKTRVIKPDVESV